MWKLFAALIGLAILGLMALGIDYAMFRAYANALNKPGGPAAYAEMRLAPKTSVLRAPTVTTALPVGDKTQVLARFSEIYPPAPSGWVRREFEEADFWKLYPELAHCQGRNHRPSMLDYFEGDPENCPLKPGQQGAMVYEKGSQIIAVFARYSRNKSHGKNRLSTGGSPRVIQTGFGDHFYNHTYPTYLRYNAIEFGRLPQKTRGRLGLSSPRLLRVYGVARGDGDLRVFVMARASNKTLKGLLMQFNRDMVGALLKDPGAHPIPKDGDPLDKWLDPKMAMQVHSDY